MRSRRHQSSDEDSNYPENRQQSSQVFKEVIFVTPVIYGSQHIPNNFSSRKIRYRQGARLHDDDVPEVCNSIPEGVIIDMPLVSIETYIRDHLSGFTLRSDDELVDGMHQVLNKGRMPESLAAVNVKGLDLMSTPLFKGFDTETQLRVMQGLSNLKNGKRETASSLDNNSLLVLDNMLRKKEPVGKREAKRLEKEKQMIVMRESQGMKPQEIAKKLKVAVTDVYRTIQRFRKAVQDQEEEKEAADEIVKHDLDKQQMKDLMRTYLEKEGIYNLKRARIHEYLGGSMKQSRVPSKNEIADMLRQEFRLRFRKLDGATVNYIDPHFDEKRLWASRLLSQFLLDDYLLISVDESHIRSDKAKKYAWQFVGNDRGFKKVLYTTQEQEQAPQDNFSQSSWGEISSLASNLSMNIHSKQQPHSVLAKDSRKNSIHTPVAEEKKQSSRHQPSSSGRDSLASRFAKMGFQTPRRRRTSSVVDSHAT